MTDDNTSYTISQILIGDDCRVRCNTHAGNPPILGIDAGSITFKISIMRRAENQSTVDFARALLREVQTFAAEVERRHAECATPDTDIPDLAA